MSVCTPLFSTRPSDRNQIWHTYSGRYGTHSQLKKFDPPHPRGNITSSVMSSNVEHVRHLKLPLNIRWCHRWNYITYCGRSDWRRNPIKFNESTVHYHWIHYKVLKSIRGRQWGRAGRRAGTRAKPGNRLVHLYNWVNMGVVERMEMLKLWNDSKENSDPGSLSWEAGVLPLGYRAPLRSITEVLKNWESCEIRYCIFRVRKITELLKSFFNLL